MKDRLEAIYVPLFIVMTMLLSGCKDDAALMQSQMAEPAKRSISSDESAEASPRMKPALAMPDAPGASVAKNAKAEIDKSNSQDGYIMVRFLDQTDQDLRITVKGPEGTPPPPYKLNVSGSYEVLPLTQGSGSYEVAVLESVTPGHYAMILSDTFDVQLTDEFAPFLRPNQYVNYRSDSEAVKCAAKLGKDGDTVLDTVFGIYHYVTENISYDTYLAQTVQKGYLPDVDTTLRTGKGICFDYSALMSAMLRSQGIPTKLVIGHAGGTYHAWIDVYSEEEGWIDKVIYFDGVSWVLMDPTFAASEGREKEIAQFIGDSENYLTERVY